MSSPRRDDRGRFKPNRTQRMHPLYRVTAYVILFYLTNSITLDIIWRIAQP